MNDIYINNVDAFVKVLGLDYPGLIHELATVPWKSDEDRDAFIDELNNIGNR